MSRISKTILTAVLAAVSFTSFATVRDDIPILAERSETLLGLERYTDARHELLRLKDIVPESDSGMKAFVAYGLAVCSSSMDSSTPADAMIEFLELYPQSVYVNDIRFRLGCLFCEKEQYVQSEIYFSQVAYRSLSKTDREKYDMQYGYALFKLGRMEEAYGHLAGIPIDSPYSHHSVYFRAYMDYLRGNYTSARRGFKSLADSDPYAPLVPYYLLQMEFASGNYGYVTREGAQVAESTAEEKKADVYRVLSESFFRLDDYRKAYTYINRYYTSGGKMDREEYYILGYSSYRLTDYSSAAGALRKVASGDDSLAQNAAYHLADCYVRLGETRDAISSFAMASSLDFDAKIKEDAMFNYGKLLFDTDSGTFNEAINVLARYVETYPKSERISEAKELLVAAYYNSRNYDMAYDAITRIENPDATIRSARQKITFFKAVDEFREGNLDEASRLLDESSKIGVSPKYNALAAYWKAETAYRRENMKDAVDNYSYFLRRAPKNGNEYAMAQYGLGYSYFNLKDYSRAFSAFRTFTDVYPAKDSFRADAFNRMGDALYSQRRFSDALTQYRSSQALNTECRYYAQYSSAITLGLLGRNREKESELKSIVGGNEGEFVDDAHYELGRMYVSQERYADAVSTLSTFTASHPSSPFANKVLLDLGLSYLNVGKSDESLKCYDAVIKSSPQSEEAKDALQSVREIYVAKGDVESYFSYASQSDVECDLSVMTRDSLTFRTAQKPYLDGRVEEAVPKLRQYLATFPKGYYTNDALFCLSDSYLRTDEKDSALETMRTLSSRPFNKYTVPVTERLAEYSGERGLYDESARTYRRLYDMQKDENHRLDAAKGYVEMTLLTGDENAIMAMADDAAAMECMPKPSLRRARFAKARISTSRGDDALAMGIYEDLAKDVSDREGAESAYRVIAALYRSGRLDECEKAVYSMADSGTTQNFWLGRSFLVLGDVYSSKGDAFQAKATYQSIVDGYTPADDGVVDEAKDRIKNLH